MNYILLSYHFSSFRVWSSTFSHVVEIFLSLHECKHKTFIISTIIVRAKIQFFCHDNSHLAETKSCCLHKWLQTYSCSEKNRIRAIISTSYKCYRFVEKAKCEKKPRICILLYYRILHFARHSDATLNFSISLLYIHNDLWVKHLLESISQWWDWYCGPMPLLHYFELFTLCALIFSAIIWELP